MKRLLGGAWRLFKKLQKYCFHSLEQRRRLKSKNVAVFHGAQGEILAAKYLKNLGYKLLERNWKSGHSEIDLIAQDKDCLVFIEVRSRQYKALISGYNSIDKHKKHFLSRGIKAYLQKHPQFHSFRLDIISIDWKTEKEAYELHHYENVHRF